MDKVMTMNSAILFLAKTPTLFKSSGWETQKMQGNVKMPSENALIASFKMSLDVIDVAPRSVLAGGLGVNL